MLKKLYCILTLFLLITSVRAQNTTIKGIVLDNNNKPLEYVSIALLSSLDNSVISGTVSHKNGSFTLQKVMAGNYKVKFYFVGYEPIILDTISLNNNQNLQLNPVKLKLANQELGEVIVSGKKANSYNKIDKQQYKASQFETAKGGTAIDIIKNLPSVTVNSEGVISLRGSNGFMVLVNGKPVLTDAATILSQLAANTIENIELITAPSAKYDPDGKGGIINIETTKVSMEGFAISSNALGGLPSTKDYNNLEKPQRFGADLTANYKKNKFDIALTLNYLRNDTSGFREGDAFTKDFIGSTITRFPSNGERSFDKHNYSTKTAVSYADNKNNTFNIGWYYGKKFQARRADLVYKNSTTDLLTETILNPFTYFNSNVQTKQGEFTLANFDYTHSFSNKSTLTSSTLYEYANLYGNTINLNLDFPAKKIIFQEVNNPYTNPIYGIRMKVDYAIEIGKGKLENGYQYRYDSQEGRFGYNISPETIPAVNNSIFRGTAKTTNRIHAVYSQYSGKSEKIQYNGGLRYEYVKREVNLSTDTEPHLINFSNVFPSANVMYTFNTAWNAKIGYSKRVQRNNNSELNPIPEREHSETLEQGDPDLLPQFVDLAEIGLNHTFKKGTLFTTFYYQNIKNPIQRVNSVYNDTILNRVYTNAERARLFGLEFGSNFKPKKWLSVYLGANVYNYKIKRDLNILRETSTVSNADWVYSINGNGTFSLDKKWSIVANANYTSAKPTAQGRDSRFLTPNLSVKRLLFEGRGSIGLQWQYIDFGNMNSNQQSITTFGTDFYTTTNYIYETNVFLINFSYNFNKLMTKIKLPSSEISEKEF